MDSEPIAVPDADAQRAARKAFAASLLKMARDAALKMKEGDDPPDWDSRRSFLYEIALAQAKAGDIAEAKSTAQVVENPWRLYERIATEQAVQNDVDGAIQTYMEAWEGKLREARCWKRLLALRWMRRWRMVVSTNERSTAFKCCSDEFLTHLIDAQIRIEDIDGAARAAECLRNKYTRGKWQRKITKAQLAEGDTAGWAELIAQTQRHSTVVIRQYLCALRRENAIARLLRRRSYGAGQKGIVAAAKEQAEIGDVDGALATLHTLAVSKADLNDIFEVEGIVDVAKIRLEAKDFSTCHRLLEDALKMAEHIQYRSYRREGFLRIALCAVCFEDGLPLAEAAWMRSEEVGGELGEFVDRYPMNAYFSIVAGYCRQGDFDAVRLCIAWDVEYWWKELALGWLAQAYAERGDFAEALATAEKLRGRSRREIAWIQAKAGNVSAAMQAAEQIDGTRDRIDAFCSIARGLARVGAMADAATAIDAALNTVSDTYDLVDVAKTQAEIGDFSEAKHSFQKALQQCPDCDRAYRTITDICKTAVAVLNTADNTSKSER